MQLTLHSVFILVFVTVTLLFAVGGMWGLNFMSEDDALQFLDVCSVRQCCGWPHIIVDLDVSASVRCHNTNIANSSKLHQRCHSMALFHLKHNSLMQG